MKIETTDESLRVRFDAPASALRVWEALTRPAAIEAWWGDNFSLDARPGGSFREAWSDGTRTVVTSGRVKRFEPPHALGLSWADDDWPAETDVLFTLTEQPEGSTTVTLDHGGFDAVADRDPRRLVADHAVGWRFHMEALRAYLEEPA